MRRAALVTALSLLAFAAGCAFESPRDEPAESTDSELGTDVTIPALPAPGGSGTLAPWGGNDSSKWRAEAVTANAASLAMNAAWSRTDVKDVVVAIPTKLWNSGFYEFGDGQANARPDFEWWRGTPRPPVVAAVIKFK